MCKEKEAQVQEMSTQHTLLKESQNKVSTFGVVLSAPASITVLFIIFSFVPQVLQLESRIHEFATEKEHLQLVHRMQEETAASAVQEKLQSAQAQRQELLDKVSQLQLKCECS